MSLSLLVDLVVAVIFLAFLIGGIKRGFVRALCSFLAVFVALAGAVFVSKVLSTPTTEFLAPYALPSIIRKLETLPTLPTQLPSATEAEVFLDALPLPGNWTQMLEQLWATNPTPENDRSPTQQLAFSLLNLFVSAAIFILAFLSILLLWGVLSRSLDLMARLPVLNVCNRILGALFGLCKALLFLFLLRWLLCDLVGIIPAELVADSYAAQFLATLYAILPIERFFLF